MNARIAAAMGFDDLYGGSEAFRERFDEMLDAVKAPERSADRGSRPPVEWDAAVHRAPRVLTYRE